MKYGGQFGLILLVSSAIVGAPSSAQAVGCATEQSKFVEDPRSTWGNKTAMYVYTRGMSTCSSVANTTFWLLGAGGFDFIEAGTRQYGSSPGTAKVFTEYRFYPDLHYQEYGDVAESQWVSFLVSNETGISYTLRAQIGFGTLPDGYVTLLTTPYAPSNYGTPMSEISRYGDADVRAHMTSMKYRPVTGGWLLWDALQCSPGYANSIMDYDGVKYSNSSWGVAFGPVQGGGC